MRYKGLLLDADGTLLDFKKSEAIGLQNVFQQHGIELTNEIRGFYLSLNETLWRGFERGEYEKQHIFDVRFQSILETFQIPGDGNEWEACYRRELNKGCHMIEGAYTICAALAKQYPLYIVTNGVSKTQYQRLHDSGLDAFFQKIFVSEDIGYQKPHHEYFAYVLEHVPYKAEELLLIGDSLSSDILGANQAGIDSCWFHEGNEDNTTNAKPTYEITKLKDVWTIL